MVGSISCVTTWDIITNTTTSLPSHGPAYPNSIALLMNSTTPFLHTLRGRMSLGSLSPTPASACGVVQNARAKVTGFTNPFGSTAHVASRAKVKMIWKKKMKEVMPVTGMSRQRRKRHELNDRMIAGRSSQSPNCHSSAGCSRNGLFFFIIYIFASSFIHFFFFTFTLDTIEV